MSDNELGEGRSCFIIGPIGDRLEPPGTKGRMSYENATQMWANVFEPACAVFGLAPVRADKIAEAGEIPEQIFTYLRDADVVIADLTGGNANVMYELGLRHTRDKITVQIGEHEHLPFDVNTIRTVKFKRNEAGLIDARNSLIEALRVALQGAGSPVTATRVWNELNVALTTEEVQRASALSFVSDDPADVADDDEGPGRLELMVEGEAAIEQLSATLSDFTGQMQEMAAIAEGVTPELENAESFAGKLTAMRRFADRLMGPASQMDQTSADYLGGVEQVDKMVQLILDEVRSGDLVDEDPESVSTFLKGIMTMAESAEEASVTFTDMAQTVRDMRKWSKVLRPLSKSIEHSLNAILRGNDIVTGWAAAVTEMPGDAAEADA